MLVFSAKKNDVREIVIMIKRMLSDRKQYSQPVIDAKIEEIVNTIVEVSVQETLKRLKTQ